MFLRLCGPPSIPLSFTAGGMLNAFAWPTNHKARERASIVYGVDYQGI